MIALLVAIARDRARQVYIGQINTFRQKKACENALKRGHRWQGGSAIESATAHPRANQN
jgi:hypothetical protein